MFAIQCAIDNHLLQRLGILGKALKAVEVSLEVPELAANKILYHDIMSLMIYPYYIIFLNAISLSQYCCIFLSESLLRRFGTKRDRLSRFAYRFCGGTKSARFYWRY